MDYKNFCVDNQRHTSYAVSYTHLDVYKRQPLAGQSLWELAKACGSTVEAIRGANHLPQEGPAPEGLLLIPVF